MAYPLGFGHHSLFGLRCKECGVVSATFQCLHDTAVGKAFPSFLPGQSSERQKGVTGVSSCVPRTILYPAASNAGGKGFVQNAGARKQRVF